MSSDQLIIGLMGRQQAGKDHTASVIRQMYPEVTRIALADPMRKALYDLNPPLDWGGSTPDSNYLARLVDIQGWDKAKEKYPEVRRLLQRFGTEMGRNNFGEDFWINVATHGKVDKGPVVITDIRFANEIAWVRSQPFGELWRITRTDLPAEDMDDPKFQHASEKDWRGAEVDVELVNPGPNDSTIYQANVLACFDVAWRYWQNRQLVTLDARVGF